MVCSTGREEFVNETEFKNTTNNKTIDVRQNENSKLKNNLRTISSENPSDQFSGVYYYKL